MKRLKLLILLFALATTLPMAYVVVRTYRGIAQEESARMRFFAETLFDAMETALIDRVELEESRPVDAYHHTYATPDSASGAQTTSPLAARPTEPYILGYLQNNPDGSFQTPLVSDVKRAPPELLGTVQQIAAINRQFNRQKNATPRVRPKPTTTQKKRAQPQEEAKSSFADKYIDVNRERASNAYLGRKTQRTEEITAQQALNVARQDDAVLRKEKSKSSFGRLSETFDEELADTPQAAAHPAMRASPVDGDIGRAETDKVSPAEEMPSRFQVEVAPLQSVFIDTERIFVFRRIVINERIYRQGFILEVEAFLKFLADTYFTRQPMARFAQLQLEVSDRDHPATVVLAGAAVQQVKFSLERGFPAPFDFLRARLASEEIPKTAARQTLTIMLGILAAVFLLGLGAIYRSVQTMVDLSERRTRFVSSVTHELKTPLTNIRMYIEMLEQGIARDAAREQDYLRVVGSESARLSRLINNVLELSRLEKKQRHFNMHRGSFQEVLDEVRDVMAEKIHQEGFTLTMAPSEGLEFSYDREVMVQILINLIENSIKFSRQSPTRHITVALEGRDDLVAVRVSDTGPGIPRHALKKVFDDFYRVEDALTRTTDGTGIGLSLVKKFVTAMGGKVTAANNTGPGCTITLRMPLS